MEPPFRAGLNTGFVTWRSVPPRRPPSKNEARRHGLTDDTSDFIDTTNVRCVIRYSRRSSRDDIARKNDASVDENWDA